MKILHKLFATFVRGKLKNVEIILNFHPNALHQIKKENVRGKFEIVYERA